MLGSWKIISSVSSVWLHFKKCFEKYFLVFGCVLENTIKNTFFYLLFTFSQLSNKYIISFLNTETQKKTKSRKKFIKFGQIERKRKRERGDWVWSRGKIVRWVRRWDCAAEARSSGVGVDLCLIGGVLRSTRSVECGSLDWSSVWGVRCCGCRTGARFEDWALSSSSLSLSLSLCVSPEMVWIENFHFKPFLGQSH